MGSDMVVALGRATADGHTLFGHNCGRPRGEGLALLRAPGRAFAPGEAVQTTHLTIPQVRQTCTVLAARPARLWGYLHGLNEHGVVVGLTSIRTRLTKEAGGGAPPPHPRLAGTDLVRLALERAPSARQAVDVVTDLISRHGQGGPSEAGGDAGPDGSFLIADAREAYAVEACGPHWALQAINEVRAAGDVCHLRQDWDRISRGLSGLAIERGWWPENGSKLDFAGALAEPGAESAAGLRRWGRATLLLEQQNGQIDTAFLRRLLADHGGAAPALPGRPHFPARAPAAEAPPAGMSLCQHAAGPATAGTAASLIARPGSRPGEIPVAWWSFGVPCTGLYFPLFLEGDLPAAFQAEASGGCQVWRQMMRLQAGRDNLSAVRPALAGLQERFDEQAREFVSEAAVLKEGGAADELRRLAGSFMQHNVEAWTALYEELAEPEGAGGPRDTLSELHYSAAWE